MAGIFGNTGVWSCGFDFLPTIANTNVANSVFDYIFNNYSVDPTYARFAGKGVRVASGAFIGRSFQVNLQSYYAGFALLTQSLPVGQNDMIALGQDTVANAQQFNLAVNQQGALGFYTDGGPGIGAPSTLVAGSSLSANGVIAANSYALIELYAKIAASGGVLQVRVNGATVLTFNGNTKKTANSFVNLQMLCAAGGGAHYFDDFYMLDTTAPAPLNTFLGNGRIQTDGPNADSASTGLNQWAFTTPQGTDYGNAANIPANAAQFNSSSTVGQRMSFRFPAFVTKPTFLNTWYSANIDVAGVRAITPIYRSNNIDQVGPNPNTLTSSFVYYNQPSIIDPNTNDLWFNGAPGAASNCEIGLTVST